MPEGMYAAINRIAAVRHAVKTAQARTNGSAGAMRCPACEAGTVSWHRDRRSDRLIAQCSTPRCASITEEA